MGNRVAQLLLLANFWQFRSCSNKNWINFRNQKEGARTLVVSKLEEVLWIRFFSSWKSQLTVKKSCPSWKMVFFNCCLFCHVWNIPTCEFDHSSPAFHLYLPKKGHDSSLSWDSHCHELFFNRNRISKTVTFLKLADLLGQVNLDPVVLILSRCKEDTIPRLEFLQCLRITGCLGVVAKNLKTRLNCTSAKNNSTNICWKKCVTKFELWNQVGCDTCRGV